MRSLGSTADIVGSLLTRSPKQSKFANVKPVSTTAIERRLQEQRQMPVEIIKESINRRESTPLVIAGSGGTGSADSHDHGVSAGGDTAGPMSEAEFNRRLARMQAEAPGKISITSGKRDPEKQKKLWADALKKYGDPEIADNWVARPGTSKHESGLAADVKFENDAVKKWYHANAKKYGLYFPMSHEPWHIQYDTKYAPAEPQTRAASAAPPAKAGARTTGNSMLDYIIQNESGWKTDAKNPNSSAFGLGQMIKANREAYGKRFGYDPNTTDGMQQLHMMQQYIKDRYGTIEKAYAFKKKHGWY